LVTTTIIIASIRHWLLEHGKESDSAKVQEDFIGIREYGESETEPRMLLNVNNNEIFYDYVVSEKPLDEIELAANKVNRYNPNYNLLKAIIFCRKKITEIAKVGGLEPGVLRRHFLISSNMSEIMLRSSNSSFRVSPTHIPSSKLSMQGAWT
jgi:hypothetical protein